MDLHRVFTRTDEVFDLEMLIQGLKEQLNLSPFLIDRGDGTGGQMHEIGQEGEGPLLCLVPDRHLSKGDRAAVGRRQPGQANHLIGEHGAVRRDGRRSRTSYSMLVRGRVTNHTPVVGQR